jgi:1-acyl-sn-glycerol-3-phosphate acyltransferase
VEGTIRSAVRAVFETMRQEQPPAANGGGRSSASAAAVPSSHPAPDVAGVHLRDGAAPAGSPEDTGFDPTFIERVAPLFEFLWSRYFRIQISGMENVPKSGPALVVSNHSGGLPYDGAMLIYGFHRELRRPLRTMVANFAFRSSWMRPVVRGIGGVPASMDNALGLLARGNLVGVFPEGLRGVGKLYRQRYRLEHFGRGGFVRLARTARVPIIPVAIVGAEEIHPVLAKLTRLAQPFGLPYIPITPTFPLLGPLGLLPVPTKWSIRVGEPIEVPPRSLATGVNGQGSVEVQGGADDDTLKIAEAVRERMDHMIAELLVRRRSILFG